MTMAAAAAAAAVEQELGGERAAVVLERIVAPRDGVAEEGRARHDSRPPLQPRRASASEIERATYLGLGVGSLALTPSNKVWTTASRAFREGCHRCRPVFRVTPPVRVRRDGKTEEEEDQEEGEEQDDAEAEAGAGE